MDTQALGQYVVTRLSAGTPKQEIREELAALGWNDEEIEEAYREGVRSLGAPVPDAANRPALARKAGAVDVVINFFSFILLGIVATSLGSLYFQVINHFFPDALDASNWYLAGYRSNTIHYATAALIIGFPLYYAALRLWFRKFRDDEGRIESKLSKWLTYLVLLAAAVTIVGDLITIVYTFLQGEVTVRFFLKALVILALAGGIFGFYFLERKKIQYRADIPRSVFQRFGIGTAAAVVVGIALGFAASGSPLTERDRSLDATRAQHLSSLSSCVEQYSLNFGRLPASLEEFQNLNEYNYCLSSLRDPETGAEYDYRVVAPARTVGNVMVGEYELCATFALETEAETTRGVNGYGPDVWSVHGTGRSCDSVQARLTQPPVQPLSPASTVPALP